MKKKEIIERYKKTNTSVYNTLAYNGLLDELKTVLADESDEDLSQILNTLSDTGYGDKDMATPLMTAAKYGNLEVVKYLLSLEATDPAVIDNRGRNALHHAAFPWESNIQKRPTIVRKLARRLGIEDINKIDEKGKTPLDLAFNNGKVSEGYQYYDKDTIDEGEETGAQIRAAIIYWIRRSGGRANKNKYDRFNKKIGPGSELDDDKHIPKLQHMKF